MIKIPEKIVAERVILERPNPITFKLAEEIYAAVDKSREILNEWLPWADATTSAEAEFSGFLYDYCDKKWNENSGFAYLIRDAETGKFLGVIDVIEIKESSKSAEIGYWLSVDAEGKGYMSAALKALENEAFKIFNRLQIRNDTQNLRSVNVAKRAGYKLDGVLRQERWLEKQQRYGDTNVWSKLKSETE